MKIKDAEPEKAVSQVSPRELQRFGWLLLKALNSGRIQDFHPNAVREYLEVAAGQPLRRAFPILLWYVENAVSRFGKTEQAAAFLRPIFDATVVGAQLAGEIAGRTLTRLKATRKRSGEFGVLHSMLITPGSRDEAMRTIATWCERNLGDYVKIADQYFAPQDLEWLQLIRASKPSCEITVLTGRHAQPTPPPGDELEDVYVSTWRRMFDQNPPRAKIAIIGGERGKKSPIHDRWLITSSAGLRLGTSLNSLGLSKDSEISEMSADDAEEKLAQIDQYLNREKAEHDGEKLRLSSFWL